MTKHCNLGAWTSNSEVIHAVADAPEGPFSLNDVALRPWHHNPQVLRHPDGTWLLFTIGTAGVPKEQGTNCSNQSHLKLTQNIFKHTHSANKHP